MRYLRQLLVFGVLCSLLGTAGCSGLFSEQAAPRSPPMVTPAPVPSDRSQPSAAPPSITAAATRISVTPRTNGVLFDSEFPPTITPNEPARLQITYQSSTPHPVSRTFVIQRQTIIETDRGPIVVERYPVATIKTRLRPTDRLQLTRPITVSTSGDNYRMAVLVYHGKPAGPPTSNTADAVRFQRFTVGTAPTTTDSERGSRSVRDFSATIERIVDDNDTGLHILDMSLALEADDHDPYTRAFLQVAATFAE